MDGYNSIVDVVRAANILIKSYSGLAELYHTNMLFVSVLNMSSKIILLSRSRMLGSTQMYSLELRKGERS